jgi:hypothetical protein
MFCHGCVPGALGFLFLELKGVGLEAARWMRRGLCPTSRGSPTIRDSDSVASWNARSCEPAVAIGEEERMANNVAGALYLDPGIPSVATVDLDGYHGVQHCPLGLCLLLNKLDHK